MGLGGARVTTLGEKVRQLRKGRQWTLKSLANQTGLSQSYLSAIEKGKRPNPSFCAVVRLADALDVPLVYFVDDDVSTEREGKADDSRCEASTGILMLHDRNLQQFIASEESLPYLAFAKQLADHNALEDPSRVLQLVAEFLSDRKPPYKLPGQ